MGFFEDLEHLLCPILAGVDELFGDDDWLSPQEEPTGFLSGPARLLSQIPRGPAVPGGPSGLQGNADAAAGAYRQSSGAVAGTDEKLAELLRQILASNDETRARIGGIVAGIQAAHRQLLADPKLANDPHALAGFNQMLDAQLAEIQRILASAKVDSKKQAELLATLGTEYRATGAEHGKADAAGGGGGEGGRAAGGGSDGGGGAGGGGGADPGGGGAGGVVDPLAGMGGMPGMMGDPMSMLGPALAGLGSIPGAFGGAGAGLPMDALGALGPLAGAMAGRGDGFTDEGTRGRTKPADFTEDSHARSEGSQENSGSDDGKDKKPQTAEAAAARPEAPSAAAAAAPAAAPGDAGLVVQMPDGTPVRATSPQHAAAVRAVLGGASVTDAWKPYVQLAPPGTPVTTPVDPSHLVAGQIAQCKSREPVMYMGNGKIWLDGQLQPQSALPAGEFLGWEDPTQRAGATPAPGPASPASPTGA